MIFCEHFPVYLVTPQLAITAYQVRRIKVTQVDVDPTSDVVCVLTTVKTSRPAYCETHSSMTQQQQITSFLDGNTNNHEDSVSMIPAAKPSKSKPNTAKNVDKNVKKCVKKVTNLKVKSSKTTDNATKIKKTRKKRVSADNVGDHSRPVNTTETSDVIIDDVVDDRSLTELLASDTPQPTGTSSPGSITNNERSLSLSLSYLTTLKRENHSLNNQIDLLQDELNRYKKSQKSLQSKVKLLTTENDQLKRQASRSKSKGMGKFIITDDSNSDTSSDNDVGAKVNSDELDTVKSQLESLRVHVADMAASLLSAANVNADTVTVTSAPAVSSTNAVTGEAFHPVTSRKGRQQRWKPATTQDGKPISVVLGVGSNGVSSINFADAQAPSHSTTTRTKAYVIGTSLTRDLGAELNKQGVNGHDVTVFTYAGCQISHIRSRLPHIFPKQHKPEVVVLQVAGNDTKHKHVDRIIDDYEGLIKDVRRECPDAKILLSSIPPRKGSKLQTDRINELNVYIKERGQYRDMVFAIDVTPKTLPYFDKGRVHFNEDGLEFYGNGLSTSLVNFSIPHVQPDT